MWGLAGWEGRVWQVLSRRLLDLYGEIDSGYPSMSVIVIGLSLPILRKRWRCLLYYVYWLPVGCCMGATGSKYLEYNSTIRTENTLNSRTLNNRTKAVHRTKQWMKSTNKTGNKQCRHWMDECLSKRFNCDHPILAWVKYLCVTELTIATLFCSCVSSWGISSHAEEFHFLPAGSPVALWRIIELPSTLCGLMPNLQSSTSWIP